MILKTDLKDCSIPDELVKSLRLKKSLLDHVRIERELSEVLGVKVDLVTEKSISPYLGIK